MVRPARAAPEILSEETEDGGRKRGWVQLLLRAKVGGLLETSSRRPQGQPKETMYPKKEKERRKRFSIVRILRWIEVGRECLTVPGFAPCYNQLNRRGACTFA